MAATMTTGTDPEPTADSVFLVTRRELVVLALAVTVVAVAVLLLVVTGGRVASALAGPA